MWSQLFVSRLVCFFLGFANAYVLLQQTNPIAVTLSASLGILSTAALNNGIALFGIILIEKYAHLTLFSLGPRIVESVGSFGCHNDKVSQKILAIWRCAPC
jgi:hypothetical protein